MKKKGIIIYLSVMVIILCSIIGLITIELNKIKFKSDIRIKIATDTKVTTDSNNIFKNKVNLNDFIVKDKTNNEASLYPYKDQDNLIGYMDENGQVKIEAKYEDGDFFSEGLAPVCLNDKWGYIDTEGNIIIKPQYDNAYCFENGLAEVNIYGKDFKDDYCIVIDKSNKEILREKGVYADTSKEGYIILYNESKDKYYDLSGNKITVLDNYDVYDGFCGDYLFASKGDNSYLFNKDFERLKFDKFELYSLQDGIIELGQEEGPKVYLNTKLQPLYLKDKYQNFRIYPRGEEIAVVSEFVDGEMSYAYVNYEGEKLFSGKCFLTGPFIDGVAAASDLYTNKACVITDKGEDVEGGYDSVEIVNNQLIIVSEDNLKHYGVKKIKGDYLIKNKYNSIKNYNNCFICKRYDDNNNSIYDIYKINGEQLRLLSISSINKVDNNIIYLTNEEDENSYYINTKTCEVIPYKK